MRCSTCSTLKIDRQEAILKCLKLSVETATAFSFACRRVNCWNSLTITMSDTQDVHLLFIVNSVYLISVVLRQSCRYYSATVRVGSIVINQSVCLSARISLESPDRSARNFVQIPCGRGSVLFRRRCAMLCTSSFMDDVTYGRNGRDAES